MSDQPAPTDQPDQPVLLDLTDGVATVTINRPDARNALNGAVARGIAAAVDELDASDELWVGVLTGAAPGALKPLLAATRPIPRGPESAGVGIPADVLRQRPDVRAAENRLAAAQAQIGAARAQLRLPPQ